MEKKEPKIKILVACHKADPAIRHDDIYMPIQVGKALHPELDLGFQGDDTGDNISEKNGSYCELTAMYWAWKNLPKDVDIVGLCHYRRYFDFENIGSASLILSSNGNDKNDVNIFLQNEADKILSGSNIIVASPVLFPHSIKLEYCYNHIKEDFDILENVIREFYPNDIHAFDVVTRGNRFSPCNMFIASRSFYDGYCDWLFGILKIVETRIRFSPYEYQQRVFGFMAERLLNVYIYSKGIVSRYCPIKMIDNNEYFIKINKFKRVRINLKAFINK